MPRKGLSEYGNDRDKAIAIWPMRLWHEEELKITAIEFDENASFMIQSFSIRFE